MKKINHKKYFQITYIEEKFLEVLARYEVDLKISASLFKKVLKAYMQEGRYYHDINHICDLINLWDSYKHLLKDQDLIFLAIIYHDVIYNTVKKNSEEKSAEYFRKRVSPFIIRLSESEIDKVCETILATKHNETSKQYWEADKDIQYMLDYDLEILGTRHASTYELYRTGVRKEYKIYPLFIYKKGRKAVLESFLKRKEIYLTTEFKVNEKRARKNLRNEIKNYLC